MARPRKVVEMDTEWVKGQLQVISDALTRSEEERRVLLELQRGYEGWLRLTQAKRGSDNEEAGEAA